MTCAPDLSDRGKDRGALFRDGDRGVDGPPDPRRGDRDHILFVSVTRQATYSWQMPFGVHTA